HAARLSEEWDLAVLSSWEGDRSMGGARAQRRSIGAGEAMCRGFVRARAQATRRGRKLYAWFDSSRVPAIQKAMLERAMQAKEWFAMGVPLNAIIRATDAPFEEVPWGDSGFLPIGLVPAGQDPIDTIGDPDGGMPEVG